MFKTTNIFSFARKRNREFQMDNSRTDVEKTESNGNAAANKEKQQIRSQELNMELLKLCSVRNYHKKNQHGNEIRIVNYRISSKRVANVFVAMYSTLQNNNMLNVNTVFICEYNFHL